MRKSPASQVNPKKARWIIEQARKQRELDQLEQVEELRARQHALSDAGKAGSREWLQVTERLLEARAEYLNRRADDPQPKRRVRVFG